MRKILLISIIILLTGCKKELTYNFSDNITSNINIDFNNKEYIEYQKSNTNEFNSITNDNEIYNTIVNQLETNYPVAYSKDDEIVYYNKTEFNNNNYSYNLKYKYEFDYDNFKDNYFFKNCFDYYTFENYDDNYYFKVSGDYLCDIDIDEIKINGSKRIENTNNTSTDADYLVWKINEKDNNIEFNILKDYSKTKIIPGYMIFTFVVIVISTLIIFFLRKKAIN